MFVNTNPAAMLAANAGLQAIGAAMMSSNAAAAAPTTGVVSPAPAEPAATLLAAQLGVHAGVYQAAAGVASALHEMMVATLASNAGGYAATEAANTIAAT